MRGIWKHNITVCLMALLFALTGNSYAGNVEVKLPTNSAFQVISGVQPLMHVGSNGKVGIGTASPEANLHISGDGIIVDSPSQAKLVLRGFSDSGQTYSSINLGADNLSTTQNSWLISHLKYLGTAYEDALCIGKWTNETANCWMVIKPDGNVGIGTTSPAYKLHVADSITAGVHGSSNGIITLASSGVSETDFSITNNVAGDVTFNNPTGHITFAPFAMSVNIQDPAADFAVRNSSGNSVFSVFHNGNVGIGTTSPSYKLHVNGTAAGTSWTNLSSREFKEDINLVGESEHPMMLAKLMEMDLSRYKYKKEYGGDDEAKLGFIAEEMPKEVLSKDGKGVDVYELLTFTIGAMKAQQKEIEVQRQYNKALEDRLAALEKLLEGK